MNAIQAITASRKSGEPVVLDRFVFEDEELLMEASVDWEQNEACNHAVYVGPDWTVELVGDGDPR